MIFGLDALDDQSGGFGCTAFFMCFSCLNRDMQDT